MSRPKAPNTHSQPRVARRKLEPVIEFSVQLANKPGQLATLTRELGDAQVNVRSLAAITNGPEGFVKLVVDKDEAAREVLVRSGVDFQEHRVITATLEDKPGALAELAEALANTGVNIEGIYLLTADDEYLHFALAVDDVHAATPLAS